MYFKFRKSRESREENLARTLDIHRPGDAMGFHRLADGGTIQRNLSSSIQECQCFESWIVKRRNIRDTIHINAWLQTQNSYFERFTQQISSVSTEQSPAGVKNSVCGQMKER